MLQYYADVNAGRWRWRCVHRGHEPLFVSFPTVGIPKEVEVATQVTSSSDSPTAELQLRPDAVH